MKCTRCFLLSLLAFSFLESSAQRIEQTLAGSWQTPLGDCQLPGTTDENKLGTGEHPTNVTAQLTRLYPYTGALTYERQVMISAEMAKKHLSLFMERTKPSTLWIDGDSIGSISQLFAPHIYSLPALKEGLHTFRIRIDNRDEIVPAGVRGSHAWTDATQTNWNGILGRFCIIGTDYACITKVDVYPDVKAKTATVKTIVHSDKKTKATLIFNCLNNHTRQVSLLPGDNTFEYTISFGKNMKPWSEFHPYLYNVKVSLIAKKCSDERSVKFGMREFSTEGTQFVINGKKTFLRGTHDACVFPITGYCPTDVESWRKVFRKAKEYGINHYRFHSYTPTEAAFEAADEEGIYLQAELPMWGTIDTTTISQNKFLYNEAVTAIDFLGNHPSFMSLGLGNELWGDVNLMHSWLDDFRQQDNRHLYVYGSNCSLGWKGPKDGEDYYVTCRVGEGKDYKTNTRSSFSFADEDDGGLLNHRRPNSSDDYSYPVSICPRPIVSHETCQFQMYPDYDQIKKYTGVVFPYNLEIFRDRLRENGLSSQAKAFTHATVTWGLDCYKADIEQCVRTPKFGGYELLDLKDYPGQGSALCGILDAMMDEKGEDTQEVKNVMQPVVPFARMDSFCWSNKDTLKLTLGLSNYLETNLNAYLDADLDGDIIANGNVTVQQGDVATLKTITVPLDKYTSATALTLNITATEGSGKKYTNTYRIWVYPYNMEEPKNVVLSDTLDTRTIKALNRGWTVVLTPSFRSIEKQSIGGLFTPDYWNYAMFKTISENNHKPVSPGSLGMMTNMDDKTKADFNSLFPNDGHTDWQWWCIAKNSRPLILNSLPKDYRPLIQTVDNVERNHKLGILMGFKVGKGKLLISTTDLKAISQYIEGRNYRNAVLQYAASYDFNPQTTLKPDELRNLLYSETKTRDIQGVKNLTNYKAQ